MRHLIALFLSLLAAPAFAQTPAPAPATSALPYRIEWGVRIPMRDGTHLDATIIRPIGNGRVPVIVSLTPYVADRFMDVGAYFARHRYAFAVVDSRGRGNSDGEFRPWIDDGRDGHDAVAWLAAQPWSDGQAGMWGGSYGGKNQWMIAGEQPRGLRTIVPASPGLVGANIGMYNSNVMRAFDHNWVVNVRGNTANNNGAGDVAYWRGLYEEISRGQVPFRAFDRLSGYPSQIWQDWMAHPRRDAFWDAASIAPDRYAQIALPTLSITGQFDGSNTGTIDFRQNHLDAVNAQIAAGSYLLIGPWDHPGTRVPRRMLGGIDLGEAAVQDMPGLHVAWFDHVMRGGPVPALLRDRVTYYVLGANAWRSAPSVDAATARRETLFLSSPDSDAGAIARHGSLVARAPRQPADAYVYDPGLPAHNEGFEGGTMVSANYLTDTGLMRRLDGDGLVYDTAPLAAPADLVGRPRATLALAMDVPDTDIRVALYEVRPDGSAIFIAQDWVRARYRESNRTERLVTPGVVAPYRFETFPFIARTIQAGSVIRMVVAPLGASFHFQRNRNSGGVIADETNADNRIAHVRLEMGRQGSRVELPWGR